MNIFRRYAMPIIALLLLCAVAAAVIMYRLGWYDISFITREADNENILNEIDDELNDDQYSGDHIQIEIETDNLSGVFDPGAA